MFNLVTIENDWKENSFSLSEDEIIEIFRSEGVTLSRYEEEIEEYNKNTHVNLSAEDRLLRIIYGDSSIEKKEEELRKIYKFPTKKHLSIESQRKIVEGCMYMVFNSTRQWYSFFEGKISEERLYYVCLEALIICVKYAVHCEDPVFELYVYKSIDRSVIKNVARWEHLSYRDVYAYVNNKGMKKDFYGNEIKELHFDYDETEILESPATIAYLNRNNHYDVDYIKDVSSDQFIDDYHNALDDLSNIEETVMQLSYDENGFSGLTYGEIAEYIGCEKKDIANIKRRALRKLKKNDRLNGYR